MQRKSKMQRISGNSRSSVNLTHKRKHARCTFLNLNQEKYNSSSIQSHRRILQSLMENYLFSFLKKRSTTTMNHQRTYTELNNKDFSFPANISTISSSKKVCFCSNIFYMQYKVFTKKTKTISDRKYSEFNKDLYLPWQMYYICSTKQTFSNIFYTELSFHETILDQKCICTLQKTIYRAQ